MKKILLLFSIMSYALVSCSQDIAAPDVPSVVKNTFQAKFAGATDIDWEKKKGYYEADFEIGNIDHEVRINPAGKIMIHKHDILASDLPQAITATISSRFKDYRLDNAGKVEKDGVVYYQIELEKGLSEKHLVYNAKGALTKAIAYWH